MMQQDQHGFAGLSDQLADAVERAATYTARVDARARHPASGVVWGDGLVLATDHAVERDEDIVVTLPDGRAQPATVVGRDHGSDLAVLRVEGAEITPPRATAAARVGAIVLAIGRPGDEGVGASFGIISAIGARRRGRHRSAIDGLLRPDLTMYPGFSGGPLVDIHGALLGINTSGLRGGALTIPADVAGDIVAQLLAHGRLRRGYLGLTSQPVRLPEAIAAHTGADTGLLVIGVEPESPAGAGGVIIGDILAAIDDDRIADTDDLRTALGPERAGQPAVLHLFRGGEPRQLAVTIGER